ncbi:MAG TPA: oligosaccharide flippase family protein [Longimicrobiales bacterium]|nr:oligosaccharide flippase family protein [Longimicrobiales bacterium]
MSEGGQEGGSASAESVLARLRRGLTWSLVGTVANQGSTFLVVLIVANLLGREQFGRFATIQSTLLTAAAVAQLAMGYTATKYLAELRSVDPGRAGRVLALCGAVAGAMAMLAAAALLFGGDALAASVLHARTLGPALRLAAPAVLFTVLNGFLAGGLAGLEAYPALGRAWVASGVAYLVVCTGGAWWAGLDGVVAALGAAAAIQTALLGVVLRHALREHGVPLTLRAIRREWGVLARFALPAALSGLVSMPALWLGNALLVRSAGGFGAMALFSAANNFRVLVLFLPAILNGVVLSVMNHARGVGERQRYRRVFGMSVGLAGGLVLAGSLVAALCGPTLLRLFGREFPAGYPTLLVLLGAAVVEALAAATYGAIQSQERLWLSFFLVAVPRDGLIVLIAYLLIPQWGALGLAAAYATGWAVALAAVTALVWRIGLGAVPRREAVFAGAPSMVLEQQT